MFTLKYSDSLTQCANEPLVVWMETMMRMLKMMCKRVIWRLREAGETENVPNTRMKKNKS